MAKAITDIEKQIPDQVEEEAQAVQQILKAAVDNRETLLKLIDILGKLHQLGLLDALQGMLKNSQEIASIGINQMNKPGAHRIIKNGMESVKFLSGIDPSMLQRILNGVSAGIEHAGEPNKKQVGLWGMVKTLREPEVMSSLTMMTKFLKGMGNGLNEQH